MKQYFLILLPIVFLSCDNSNTDNSHISPIDTVQIKVADTAVSAPDPIKPDEVVSKDIATNLVYSNGNKFIVTKYVYTDMAENILDQKPVKQSIFIIDDVNKVIKMEMADIFYEHYYYNKVDRVTVNGKTRDVYGIYRSFNSKDKNKALTDVMIIGVNSITNEAKYYQLYFGDKGFITFSLSPIK
ncbi:MAG TPA: hypothetical protein PK816_16355 [Candidatus Cloacimonadota bacterium]|nr:hypothetical protein [Candidatus Cloacimonadota bacterium]